jgi:hypothetical protein
MRRPGIQPLAVLILGSSSFMATAAADAYHEVTVTNVTKGMTFTTMVANTR